MSFLDEFAPSHPRLALVHPRRYHATYTPFLSSPADSAPVASQMRHTTSSQIPDLAQIDPTSTAINCSRLAGTKTLPGSMQIPDIAADPICPPKMKSSGRRFSVRARETNDSTDDVPIDDVYEEQTLIRSASLFRSFLPLPKALLSLVFMRPQPAYVRFATSGAVLSPTASR
ncbi:hypothetical protein EIP91_003923 [Steccherinum ochraceum]|uniref:Uncharacterized protein n=1 Tax=Steccherinum ochraceum TaxID=92696 RepID=A0A4R0S204_9APHY|nr:hypothetical protein EIP91_003923 [Steccherinum ochraceum]